MQTYNKALNILMKSPVTDDMIQYLTRVTLRVLPSNNYPSPPNSPMESQHSQQRLPSLRTFITRLVRYTNVYTPTLLTTVCYLNKLKRILPKDAKGLPSTIHRLFLACLILSAKFHNDSSPLNKHWAKYTDGLFNCEDINLMERQLLNLLNWDLRVSEEDLILDLQTLLEPIRDHIMRTQIQIKKRQQSPSPVSSINSSSSNLTSASLSINDKLYDHQRNISVASNLSSATLVNASSQNLKGLRSASSSSVNIWHEPGTNNYSWNLEQQVQ